MSSPRRLSLYVDKPGHGEILLIDCGPVQDEHAVTLRGGAIGAMLQQVTALALCEYLCSGSVPTLGRMTRAEAEVSLPDLQAAAILAGAGPDRYERLLPVVDLPPHGPICVHCGEGSPYDETQRTTNSMCDERGHTPFGSVHRTWKEATEHYEAKHAWWEQMRPLRPGAARCARSAARVSDGATLTPLPD
jgi:hypothetical protein